MNLLELLATADAPVIDHLTAHSHDRIAGNSFDNRPTWDNIGIGFDNRPTWDNWNKTK
ncbi:multiple cyclophane-containing RiPP AmcA [Streptomyces specialis]|uniref:multiple cyclophane-containing RiPP AmcA n=1 Tax=Streptomyces specialis TaxID=498367 RepID=UPI000A85ED8B|nr:multiple cyclophane-containing RiPP AmcA [Streptomyces specialis]